MIPVKDFALAGKAVFTLTGVQGNHYTYRINKATANPKFPGTTWWVQLGIGYEDAIAMGRLNLKDGVSDLDQIIFTPAKGVNPDSPSASTFLDWFAAAVVMNTDSPIRFQHEGRCCVCGRPLTNPESIDAGIGPECAGKS